MANHKTKLELTWIGKENRPKLEPHRTILIIAPTAHLRDRGQAAARLADGAVFDPVEADMTIPVG
ncbi:MAG: hypothetical protein FIA90_06450 [candidate division NC10 bacterium]|nr:hypothetical protein [Candidatus Methylomirabilis sp.]NJD68281.1 hypothetical protein [candidate division NC10 bacterium]